MFNGDIVDRGDYSVECLLTLLAFKIAEPDNFFINLGNHETTTTSQRKKEGKLLFKDDAVQKYGSDEFFDLAHVVFRSFPYASVIQNEVFVVHGGIEGSLALDAIRKVDRVKKLSEADKKIFRYLTWSDPRSEKGSGRGRGKGVKFGPDVTLKFLKKNDLSVVIRSHEYQRLGFIEDHDKLCITIFSCPNYK